MAGGGVALLEAGQVACEQVRSHSGDKGLGQWGWKSFTFCAKKVGAEPSR